MYPRDQKLMPRADQPRKIEQTMLKIKITVAIFACQIYVIAILHGYVKQKTQQSIGKENYSEPEPEVESISPTTAKKELESDQLGLSESGILQVLHQRAENVSKACRVSGPKILAKYKETPQYIDIEKRRRMRMLKGMNSLLIMPENKIIWCLVPKVASTSISKAIIEMNNLTSKLKNTNQPQLFLKNEYRNPNLIALEYGTSKFVSFYITRHPFDRIVSAYRNKFENSSVHDGPYFYKRYGKSIVSNYRKARRTFNEGVDLDLKDDPLRKEPTFREFIKYLLSTDEKRYDDHWKPISKLCNVCRLSYDYVISFENFNLEFGELQNFLKREQLLPKRFEVKWENMGVSDQEARGNLTKEYLKKLPSSFVKSLYNKYRKDFEYFGYDINEYL